MGASPTGMKAAEQPAAESLLSAFKTLSATERRRHASVLNYWLSVRGDKEFPPLHDLDPLELSDAGPNSILMELIGGGHDAEIRHLGEALRDEAWPERIIDAPNPSVLACIAKKLPIVAISRDFLAFEDEYDAASGKTRCSVTLLPLSAGGAWVDYVYAFVSVDAAEAQIPDQLQDVLGSEENPEIAAEDHVAHLSEVAEAASEPELTPESWVTEDEEPQTGGDDDNGHFLDPLDVETAETHEHGAEDETVREERPSAASRVAPGFSRLLDNLAGLTGFYGSHPVKVEPVLESEVAQLDENDEDEPVDDAQVDAPPEPPLADEQPDEQEDSTADKFAADTSDGVDDPTVSHAETVAGFEEEPSSTDEPLPQGGEITEHEPTEDGERDVAAREVAAENVLGDELADTPAREAPAQTLTEGTLQDKLTKVRSKADDAHAARLRADAALAEGLSAAYDFALDAEEAPEDYLRLVEAQGLKIQLRSPMKPVVKLAFGNVCDEPTIKQLEAILAWAFDEELPRGTLAGRIEAAGGLHSVLAKEAKAA